MERCKIKMVTEALRVECFLLVLNYTISVITKKVKQWIRRNAESKTV